MFKCLALMLSLCVGAVGGALAQEVAYPTKTIRLVVPFPPGGSVDVVARMVSLHLQEKFGQTIVIENRPGAVGTMGTAQVAKAAPDGHTLVMTIGAHTIVPALMAQMPYDASRDLAAVTLIASAPNVLVVRPDFPARNLKEFVQLAKENPGKFSYSTAGNGSTTHVMTAMLAHSAGLSLLHVPYQGGAPLVTAMIGGQLSSAFLDAGSSKQHLPKFKLLGVTGTERLSWLPNVPTLKEQGLNSYEPMGWFGLFLPGATPKPVVDKFSAETQRILKLPDVREKIEAMGLIPGGETTESFTKIVKSDADIYARIIRDAKITLN